MRKKYIRPLMLITEFCETGIICTSILGIDGTGSLNTSISSEETSDYLSRRGSLWDDEDEDW